MLYDLIKSSLDSYINIVNSSVFFSDVFPFSNPSGS